MEKMSLSALRGQSEAQKGDRRMTRLALNDRCGVVRDKHFGFDLDPRLDRQLLEMPVNFINPRFVADDSHQPNLSILPRAILFEQMSQQQHQLAILSPPPPNVDRARRRNPWIFVGMVKFRDDQVAPQRFDHPHRSDQRFCFAFGAGPTQQQRVGTQRPQTAALNQILNPLRQ